MNIEIYSNMYKMVVNFKRWLACSATCMLCRSQFALKGTLKDFLLPDAFEMAEYYGGGGTYIIVLNMLKALQNSILDMDHYCEIMILITITQATIFIGLLKHTLYTHH